MSDSKDKKGKKRQKLKEKLFGKSQEIVSEVTNIMGVGGGPPDREQLISRHKTLSRDISRLKEELVQVQTVLYELADEYDTSKGDCPCCRYNDLKRMVEVAILRYSGSSLPRGTAEGASTRTSVSSDESRPLLGSTTGLLQNCRRLAESENKIMRMERKYKDMTEEDLRHGILFLTKEEASLHVTFDTEKKKINRLASQYRRLNDRCFCKRYGHLKKIVKEAIVDYHDTLGVSVDI